jgi:3-methyladenine DNA glycosylase AlkC
MAARRVVDSLDADAVCAIAERLLVAYPRFPKIDFLDRALANLDSLPLFERADHIADALRHSLPAKVPKAIELLVRSLGPPREGPGYGTLENFRVLPLTRFVGRFGLPFFDESMSALYEMTRRFTAEFDIRPFLVKYPSRTMAAMRMWVQDPDLHVRRLVSEGTRPRLPWAKHLEQFKHDPVPVIQLLDCLKDDRELYVRRSVANNLADIVKDNPDVGYQVLTRWSYGAPPGRRWLIKHAVRFPCARGDVRALELLKESG